jgi:type IV pilus assembly protein PilB
MGIGLSPAEAKHTEVFAGKGCQKCSGTGYKGRVALYECMEMKDTLKDFVLNGASAAEIKKEAIRAGMNSLRLSGIQFLKQGVTTIEEVLRVTAAD